MTHDPHHFSSGTADQLIDRTLSALCDAQPRAGHDAMNRRILATLQARQLEQPSSTAATSVWQAFLRTPRTYLALTMAAALLGLIVAVLLRPHTTAIAPSATTDAANHLPQATSALTGQIVSHARNGMPPNQSPRRCWAASNLTCATPRLNIVAIHATPALSPGEQALLDDLHAPSHPAPPMPLTHDERMMLRAARQGSEVQLAQLESLPRPESRNTLNKAVAQYIHHMLAPLAMAEALNPTPSSDTEPAADTAPPR